MLVSCLLFLFFLQGIETPIPVNQETPPQGLIKCVKDIISQYYENGKGITYVDMDSGDNNILKAINEMFLNSITTRRDLNKTKMLIPHQGYVIHAGNTIDFIKDFHYIRREPTWNPKIKFLIIINRLFKNELRIIFDQIFHVRVKDVLVINGTNEADIYTYNPYENYACGRYFERIIEYGQCSKPTVSNLYPDKLVTGLRNCTISVTIPHMPPHTIFPNKDKTKKYSINRGMEQFAFDTLSELEKFKINYSYVDFAESFSLIDGNMKAKGYFQLILKNKTDVLFGSIWLTASRAAACDYLYMHLVFTDTLSYFVKTAEYVPTWMNMYLEFDSNVWILLFLCFVLFSTLIVVLIRTDDKVSIILKLWDSLFLHGFYIRGRSVVKCVLLFWAWFAYLINCFYQSSLVSLTTHPSKLYQVSAEKDLVDHVFNSCLSPTIRNLLIVEANMTFDSDIGECDTLKEAFKAVSEVDGLYTIVPFSIYLFNRHKYFDKSGTCKVFHFPVPVMKLLYGMFLYKGFPMGEKLHKHTIYLRQSGLIDKFFNDLYYDQAKVHKVIIDHSFKPRLIVPLNILIVGCSVSLIVFVLEVFNKKQSVESIDMNEF